MQSHHPNHALRAARKKRELTQEELAEMLGVSPKTIGRWERGETRPGDYECKRLCQILQQSEEELGLTDISVEWNTVTSHTDEHPIAVSDDPGLRTNDVKLLLASFHQRNARLSYEPPSEKGQKLEVPSSHDGDSSSWRSLQYMKRLRVLLLPHLRPDSARTVSPSLHSRRVLLQSGLIGGLALCSTIGLIRAAAESGIINIILPHQREWPIARYNLYRTLSIVRVLQWMLKARDYDLGPTGVDGIFGPYTLQALRSFQSMSHLPVHDYADDATWEKLIIPSAINTSGDQVMALQEQLNMHGAASGLMLDGIFGPETQDAVRSFQQYHRLSSTGQADLDTWCVLIGGHFS